MAVAALGGFVAARGPESGPSAQFVVVSHDVIAGTKRTANDLRVAAVDLPDELAAHAFRDLTAVVGRVAPSTLARGELVQSSAVVAGDAADPRFQLSIPSSGHGRSTASSSPARAPDRRHGAGAERTRHRVVLAPVGRRQPRQSRRPE